MFVFVRCYFRVEIPILLPSSDKQTRETHSITVAPHSIWINYPNKWKYLRNSSILLQERNITAEKRSKEFFHSQYDTFRWLNNCFPPLISSWNKLSCLLTLKSHCRILPVLRSISIIRQLSTIEHERSVIPLHRYVQYIDKTNINSHFHCDTFTNMSLQNDTRKNNDIITNAALKKSTRFHGYHKVI